MAWQPIVYVPAPGQPWMGDSGAGARVCGATFELKHTFCILGPLMCFTPGYYPHLKHTLGSVGHILCFSREREIPGRGPG